MSTGMVNRPFLFCQSSRFKTFFFFFYSYSVLMSSFLSRRILFGCSFVFVRGVERFSLSYRPQPFTLADHFLLLPNVAIGSLSQFHESKASLITTNNYFQLYFHKKSSLVFLTHGAFSNHTKRSLRTDARPRIDTSETTLYYYLPSPFLHRFLRSYKTNFPYSKNIKLKNFCT